MPNSVPQSVRIARIVNGIVSINSFTKSRSLEYDPASTWHTQTSNNHQSRHTRAHPVLSQMGKPHQVVSPDPVLQGNTAFSSLELDRCLHNRYKMDFIYDRVYIDFDDTIIVDRKVNVTALKYLYQGKNKGIKVSLLSKHKFDLRASLTQYSISENLFDEIIVLSEDEDKANYIIPDGAIFIDNYFFDRERISKKLKMPVFDVDAIECLLD